MFAPSLRTLAIEGLILICVMGPTQLSASPTPSDGTRSRNSVDDYAFDFLTFKTFDDNRTFLEIFALIPVERLSFVPARDSMVACYSLNIAVFDSVRGLRQTEAFQDSVVIHSQFDTVILIAPHLVRFAFNVEPGQQIVEIQFADMNNESELTFLRNLTVPNYDDSSLQISSLQLATSVREKSRRSVLVKNQNEIIPNVRHIFGPEHPVLHVYLELYNLEYQTGTAGEFRCTYRIEDIQGNLARRIQRKFKKPGRTAAFSVGIPVSDLESGEYQLHVTIYDPSSRNSRTGSQYFAVVNPGMPSTERDFARLMRQLRYVISEAKLDSLESLPQEERLHALQTFWRDLDPDPSTFANEFAVEHFRRIRFANHSFHNLLGEGWETDQGRIYITNGPPDKVSTLEAEDGDKTYQVWLYRYLDRKYVFIDPWGLGGYQLLGSSGIHAPDVLLDEYPDASH